MKKQWTSVQRHRRDRNNNSKNTNGGGGGDSDDDDEIETITVLKHMDIKTFQSTTSSTTSDDVFSCDDDLWWYLERFRIDDARHDFFLTPYSNSNNTNDSHMISRGQEGTINYKESSTSSLPTFLPHMVSHFFFL